VRGEETSSKRTVYPTVSPTRYVAAEKLLDVLLVRDPGATPTEEEELHHSTAHRNGGATRQPKRRAKRRDWCIDA